MLEPGRREVFREAEAQGGMPYPAAFLRDDGEVIHPPLKFAVSYSGFGAPIPLYRAFYEPKIQTPLLHFLGSLDTVVEESRSQRLIDASVGKKEERVIVHPGGHFLPSQKQYVNMLIGFIKDALAKDEGPTKEESVEDMDVPF